jgi:hypothetical protein
MKHHHEKNSENRGSLSSWEARFPAALARNPGILLPPEQVQVFRLRLELASSVHQLVWNRFEPP